MSAYSRLDRMVHRLAFAAPWVQRTAADIEETLFAADYAAATGARPIFITSLPRAGTTILLEALNRLPGLATHLYRDMPFVMAPLLWSRLSAGFRKDATLQERAHGDGITIGFDSPEAFEELIWRSFWPDHYGPHFIDVWRQADAAAAAEARDFFVQHFRKIIALRCGAAAAKGRYISKNNGNVARLSLLPALFPDATIVVPLRDPQAHAASLHRQHLNFLKLHAEDSFTRTFMADIGHLEFGALHRPFGFDGLDTLVDGLDPMQIDYWLAYWIAAFEHVARHAGHVQIVSFEAACTRPAGFIASLCAALDLDPAGQRDEIAAMFKPQEAHLGPDASPELVDRARALHANLAAQALV